MDDPKLFELVWPRNCISSTTSLCTVCVSATKKISDFLTSWKTGNRPKIDPDWYRPANENSSLPANVIKHHDELIKLPESSKNCSFCELMRVAFILGYEFAKSGGEFRDIQPDKSKIFDVIQDEFRNARFAKKNNIGSVYFVLVPAAELARGDNSDGFYLERIRLRAVRPASTVPNGEFSEFEPPSLVAYAEKDSLAHRSGALSCWKPIVDSSSDDALQLLKRWPQRCNEKHHLQCRKTISGEKIPESEESVMPSRILDVGTAGSGSIRLVQTNGQYGRWVALSHCWGDPAHQPLKTTKSSLKDRLAGIPLSQLPKTFADAVLITREMGLKYIWIDSLCIIQDDEDDWRRESKTMGLIYERAYVTLAASASKDSRGGLLMKRHYASYPRGEINLPLCIPETEAPYVDMQSSSTTFQVALEWREYPLSPGGLAHLTSSLAQRGWATQEWILSRRTIHFLDGGFAWVCKSRPELETGRSTSLTPGLLDWTKLISEHSNRSFTYERDRLISLSGLVVEMSKGRPDRYVSGLWSEGLPKNLLWNSTRAEANLDIGRVPSWSWASRLGHIIYTSPSNFWSLCTIDNISKSGVLYIQGMIRVVPTLSKMFGFVSPMCERLSKDDFNFWQKLTGCVLFCSERPMRDGEQRLGVGCLDGRVDDRNKCLHLPTSFLLLGHGTWSTTPGQDRTLYTGLLLQESREASDTYERVGMFAFADRSWLWQGSVQTIGIV